MTDVQFKEDVSKRVKAALDDAEGGAELGSTVTVDQRLAIYRTVLEEIAARYETAKKRPTWCGELLKASAKREQQILKKLADAQALTREAGETWRDHLSIATFSCTKSGFGTVEWKVSIKNSAKSRDYKDVTLDTQYVGESGTRIDQGILKHREFKRFPAGKTVSFRFSEFGSDQTRRCGISIEDAKDD